MKKIISTILIILASATLVSATTNKSNDTLVIGYYPSAPFIIENGDNLDGISIWLWESIQRETGYPYKLKKMTLDEVVKGLAQDEIDMTLNPLTINSIRSEVMDFSAPYYISNSSVMVNSVGSFEKGMQFISSFFSLNFLRAIGALFLVVFIFGTLAWVFEHRKNPEEFKPGIKGLWSGIWWSAVTMTTVGYGDKSPRSTGGRVIALIWMFAAIIIISGFTASIASSLTVNQLSWNQNKIKDFKEKRIAVIDNSATQVFLEQRFFKELYPYQSLKACVEALEKGDVDAVSHDVPQLTYISGLDSLDRFDVLPIRYNPQLYAFGFTEKMSEHKKEVIGNELLKIIESTDWRVLLSEYNLEQE